MKILITGGAGFIGSNLSEKLLNLGHTVYCLDNFYSSTPQNIKHLSSNPSFHLIKHDILWPLDLGNSVEQIYNLACPASPPWYQKDPLLTIRTNTEGLFNVLDYAKSVGAKVLQASTSEVYGDPLEHPQKESYRGNVNINGPRACYDESKRVA